MANVNSNIKLHLHLSVISRSRPYTIAKMTSPPTSSFDSLSLSSHTLLSLLPPSLYSPLKPLNRSRLSAWTLKSTTSRFGGLSHRKQLADIPTYPSSPSFTSSVMRNVLLLR